MGGKRGERGGWWWWKWLKFHDLVWPFCDLKVCHTASGIHAPKMDWQKKGADRKNMTIQMKEKRNPLQDHNLGSFYGS